MNSVNQPKGHRSMEVQGANRRDKNFREPSVNPTWVFQLRLVSGGCGLTGTPNINQSLGKISQKKRSLGHNFNTWKNECMLSFKIKDGTSHPEPIRYIHNQGGPKWPSTCQVSSPMVLKMCDHAKIFLHPSLVIYFSFQRHP